MTRTLLAATLSLLVCLPLCGQDDPKQDPPKADEKAKLEAEKAKLEEQQRLQAALKSLLLTPCTLGKDNKASVYYGASEVKELEDWRRRGFDVFDIDEAGTKKARALEVGAGSRKAGTALHKLPLRGDFTIKIGLFIPVSTPSSVVCFLLGKKVGVSWGQQIVKARSLRPYNRRARLKKTVYREERDVELIFKREGQTLTIKCNGLLTDKRTFKKGELDGIQFGILARNVRLAITRLEIEGVVDAKALLKQGKTSKKSKKKKKS